jgi:hypothetical protein
VQRSESALDLPWLRRFHKAKRVDVDFVMTAFFEGGGVYVEHGDTRFCVPAPARVEECRPLDLLPGGGLSPFQSYDVMNMDNPTILSFVNSHHAGHRWLANSSTLRHLGNLHELAPSPEADD